MRMSDLRLPEGVCDRSGDRPDVVAQNLADSVAAFLSTRLKAAPRASLVVSGGSTPLPFFRALSTKDLDWRRVDVLLADERWIGEEDDASNTRLVRENLLQNNAASARFLSLKQAGDTPVEGLALVKEELAELALPIDVLVLGMGTDGHTASLFPDAPELVRAMDPECRDIVTVTTPASQPQNRISLTRKPLGNALFTALHLKGEDKLGALAEAISAPEKVLEMPVRAFLKPGLQVFWSP